LHRCSVGESVATLLTVLVEVRLIVERGRGSQRADQQSGNVVAALNERAARIDVVEVAAECELAADFLGAFQAEACPVVLVVRPLDDPVLIRESDRRIERRAVVTTGELNVVVSGQSGFEQLANVIVGDRSCGQLRAPGGATGGGRAIGGVTARGGRIGNRSWIAIDGSR